MADATGEARQARLKAALRENLKRRKAQLRARGARPDASGGDADALEEPGRDER